MPKLSLRIGLTVATALVLAATVAADQRPRPRTLRVFGPPQASGTAGGLAQGTDLFRRDLDRSSGAACADGTPGVFYVRPARTRANADKWVIFLQGGAECKDGTDCANRWMDTPGDGDPFNAKKLSSSLAPLGGMRGTGIESPDETKNRFATWNHVFLYYCSSDRWLGSARTRTEADLTLAQQQELGLPATVEYWINFQGADIIDAVIRDLSRPAGLRFRGAMPPELTPVDVEMPSLRDANVVLFAGSSAGGVGVINHADRLNEQLCRGRGQRPERCSLHFAAVVDAAYLFPLSDPNFDFSQAVHASESEVQEAELNVIGEFWGGRMNTDRSCRTLQRDTPWVCADSSFVFRNHLTSPRFLRVDLLDPLLSTLIAHLGVSYAGFPIDGSAVGQFVFGTLMQRSLEALLPPYTSPGSSAPIELTVSPNPNILNPGVHGPQCSGHESMRSDGPALETETIGADSLPHTTNELIWNWLTGTGTPVAIQALQPGVAQVAGCVD